MIIGRELSFRFLPMDQYRSKRFSSKKSKSPEEPQYKSQRIVNQSTISPLHVVTADAGALIAPATDSSDHVFIEDTIFKFSATLKEEKTKRF